MKKNEGKSKLASTTNVTIPKSCGRLRKRTQRTTRNEARKQIELRKKDELSKIFFKNEKKGNIEATKSPQTSIDASAPSSERKTKKGKEVVFVLGNLIRKKREGKDAV
jgi:hypothetical protein